MTDAQGIPLAAFADSAGVAEVHLLEPTLASIPQSIRLPERMPLIADRAYDSDPLRATLAERGIDLIAPHRKNRTAAPTNDGRKLRRYKRRWKVERTFASLGRDVVSPDGSTEVPPPVSFGFFSKSLHPARRNTASGSSRPHRRMESPFRMSKHSHMA